MKLKRDGMLEMYIHLCAQSKARSAWKDWQIPRLPLKKDKIFLWQKKLMCVEMDSKNICSMAIPDQRQGWLVCNSPILPSQRLLKVTVLQVIQDYICHIGWVPGKGVPAERSQKWVREVKYFLSFKTIRKQKC